MEFFTLGITESLRMNIIYPYLVLATKVERLQN